MIVSPFRATGKLFPSSSKRASALHRAVTLPEPAFSRAFGTGRDRPSQCPRLLPPFRRVPPSSRRVVGSLPDGRSTLMLVAARLRHIAGTKWGLRRHMNIDRLKDQRKEVAAMAG